MTSNWYQVGNLCLFGTQWPKISLYTEFQLNISFPCSQILWCTFCNFVTMATAQNSTNWFDLQNVSYRFIFKFRKFQIDTLSRFRMMDENRRGGGGGRILKIGLKLTFRKINECLRLLGVVQNREIRTAIYCSKLCDSIQGLDRVIWSLIIPVNKKVIITNVVVESHFRAWTRFLKKPEDPICFFWRCCMPNIARLAKIADVITPFKKHCGTITPKRSIPLPWVFPVLLTFFTHFQAVLSDFKIRYFKFDEMLITRSTLLESPLAPSVFGLSLPPAGS